MEKIWFYAKEGSSYKTGPVMESEMLSLMAQGQLPGKTLAWTEGMSNWKPLQDIPEFQQLVPSIKQVSSDLPPGLTRWMALVGVISIVAGVIHCLGCFTMITGIPMILGGVALLGAKSVLASFQVGEQPELRQFFLKLRTYLIMAGVVYIITIAGATLLFVLLFAAVVSGSM
ncbi:MAG: DUF5362 family protein [Lentisphaerota bacterium]